MSIRESSENGYVLSKETRKRMSKSRKGRLVTDETRLKISISETGKVVTNKTRKLLSESYRDTKERRDKLSNVAKNRMKNPINRGKISTTLKK